MQLTASFTIQAFEALPPGERTKFLKYIERQTSKAPVRKTRTKKSRLRPEHSNLDLLRDLVIKENNITITQRKSLKPA